MATSTEDPSLAPAPAGRAHSAIALAMLASVVGTCLLLDGLARVGPLTVWMRDVSWEQNRVKRQLPIFCYNNHLTDYEEHFLHETLPAHDFSKGGVYFLGASTLKWALKPWALPPETRPLINDFGFGGVRHSDQADFLRYLVEDQGMLKAGPEKTLVVFGTNYRIVHQGRFPGDPPSDYFRQMFTRHGFYTMDSVGTIHDAHPNFLTRLIRLEPARMTGFLRDLVNIAYLSVKPKRVHNPKFYNAEWVEAMGPDWDRLMDSELAYLKGAFEFLQSRGAKVAVVLFPMATWDNELPYQPVYVKKLRKICDETGVKVHDLTKIMPDDDFADSDHLNPDGIEKFQKAVMGLCLDHLRSTGLLPAENAAK